ncbi:hypothetical protein Tco_1016243 [Tanacetum coccineum]|uniref:No apical meristem-associated C-terminal domain-containing protein n=1 Tax=Tanacetum coccineum TaxID=301880 RepID=A0ABQ5FPA9_9ASTR
MESSTSSQPNQPYSPINPTNLDMNFEELIFSQDYNYSQDYSIGHGSGHGSAPGLAHGSDQGSIPFHDKKDDSLIKEVSLVKPKKPFRHVAKAKKDEPKEAKGFWKAVIRVRPRIGAFCAIIKNIEANHESGTNDLDVYQKACVEYKMMYKGDFTLEHCYNILKDHPGWKNVEMPNFYQSQGRKKSKTSETTSGSASGGLNLNEEADEAVEETQEFRPMGRDRAKAKLKQSVPLVGELLYLLICIRESEAREIAQLKREKLEIQRRTLELAEREKRDRDILFYNSAIDTTLPPIQQEKLLEMKMEIKARYNLDY